MSTQKTGNIEEIEAVSQLQPVDQKEGDDILKRHAHDLSMEDRALALKLAQEADPGLPPNSYRMFRFVLLVLTVCMCSGDNGFDGTIMSSVNSMSQFLNYFDLAIAEKGTGIVFGVYTVGSVCSFFITSWLPDKFGRRWGMFLGNCLLCTGALVTAFATSKNMFIGGRFLTGLGCSTGATSAKSYLTEITSPATRGRWLGLLNSFYYVGQLLASGVAIPFGRFALDNAWAWRGPILLQCLPAVINVAFIMFQPESPRWLYAQGRKDEAVEILAQLHSRNMDVNSPLIKLEIEEIEVNISVDGSDKRWWDFRSLFNTAGNRYRFGLCAIVSVWGQLSGNGLITYFLPVLLLQAGITDSDKQRVLNFVNSITSFMGALTGTSLIDHVGRRKLMLFASCCCMCGMFIVAGLLSPAGDQTSTRANAGITFIFLFMVLYSVGWTPNQALYPAEVLAFQNRAKGLALQGWVTNVVSLINTFGLPSALAALTWRTYLIFGCWDIVGVITIYLVVVETKQLSLEDIDEVFASKSPKQTSFKLYKQAKERAKEDKRAREGIAA